MKYAILPCFLVIVSSCASTPDTTEKIIRKNPEQLFDPTAYGFSHASFANIQGKYVFISGQSGAEDLDHRLSDDFRRQVQFALKNLEGVLKENDLSANDVLKITVLIVDHDAEKLEIWTKEMRKFWKDDELPASTLIPVPRLALDKMLIEVDAIAFKTSV